MLQGYRGEYLMQEQHNVKVCVWGSVLSHGIFEHLKKTEGAGIETQQEHGSSLAKTDRQGKDYERFRRLW